jgi:ornithine decarboxylase
MKARDLLTSSVFRANYDGPVVVVDRERIIENIKRFRQALPGVEINYAVKSNPDPKLLTTIMDEGASFEVASLQELQAIKVAADQQLAYKHQFTWDKVLYSNPVRPDRYIRGAINHFGCNWFVVDNPAEVYKVISVDPTANLYIRLIVCNHGSRFSLYGKFGVDWYDAKDLITFCKEVGANVRGVTFHVGSQCLNPRAWGDNVQQVKDLFEYMRSVGFNPDFLDIGGGFPVQHCEKIPSIEEIGEYLMPELEWFKGCRIVAEPGRFITSDAGHMLCQVISTNIRNERKWVYLDAGVFHGMTEPAYEQSFHFAYETDHDSDDVIMCVLAGPTCDSLDVINREEPLPAGLLSGDFVVVKNCGVYTTSYGTEFNGFPSPKLVVL